MKHSSSEKRRRSRDAKRYVAEQYLLHSYGKQYSISETEMQELVIYLTDIIRIVRSNDIALVHHDLNMANEYFCVTKAGKEVFRLTKHNRGDTFIFLKGIFMLANRYGTKPGFWMNKVSVIHAYRELGVYASCDVVFMKKWLEATDNVLMKGVIAITKIINKEEMVER